ncbi:arabinan endo-1,5-alpha-L-arabinosidase [Sphingomonadaceae bacterium LXI357]|uniref:Extracellular exo-alpha-(1->5)-L-arabinofuranosidase n=2 Tax=Stakelama marina TaxID=2826939 RepID=A0A8T4IE42_9SPHN|nr:arabinan endo-1,5-alpha-L-arabinosidase [Stakelama marina]MBR0552813.1 arabinan endo-1,5-alpha-L-arabinosidase [Stakelama marina]
MRPGMLAVAMALAAPACAPPASPRTMAGAAEPLNKRLSGDIVGVHDPVLIRAGGNYYVYSTGRRGAVIEARRSPDLVHWRRIAPPFATLPDWVGKQVPGAHGIWAPDIAKVGGTYRLYYAVSTFGSRHSAIGLATSKTLDPDDPDYGWHDHGMVVASSDADNFNAIDPNLVIAADGRQWLAFGSFWDGIKLVELDPATGLALYPDAKPIALARRPDKASDGAIEAPFIVRHGGWYWLFASDGFCCRGVKSTYHIVVGRSRAVTGPYRDRQGMPMLDGGGTLLLAAGQGDRFRGPGHSGFLHDRDGTDYLVYHAYDAANDGKPTLRIAKVEWSDGGWPKLGHRAAE